MSSGEPQASGSTSSVGAKPSDRAPDNLHVPRTATQIRQRRASLCKVRIPTGHSVHKEHCPPLRGAASQKLHVALILQRSSDVPGEVQLSDTSQWVSG